MESAFKEGRSLAEPALVKVEGVLCWVDINGDDGAMELTVQR